MIAAVELEMRMIVNRIFGIIVRKFRHRQESCPIVLPPIDKNTQISLHIVILHLGLVVCPRMKCGEKFLPNAKKIT